MFVGFGEFPGEEIDDGDDFLLLRLGSLAGRHFAEVELIKNALPDFESFNLGEIVPEGIETQVAFLFFGAMAVVAMMLKKGLGPFKWIAKEQARSAEQEQETGSHGRELGFGFETA